FPHELPCPIIPSRRASRCSSGNLPPDPPHDSRTNVLQFADVPATLAAAPDPPQPARTYSAPASAVRRALLAGLWLCATILKKDGPCPTQRRRPANRGAG